MANEKIYVKGIRLFNPHEKAPDWVVASGTITPRELLDWLKSAEVASNLTDYNGKDGTVKQLRIQITKGEKGMSMMLDTFKKDAAQGAKETTKNVTEYKEPEKKWDDSSLPF